MTTASPTTATTVTSRRASSSGASCSSTPFVASARARRSRRLGRPRRGATPRRRRCDAARPATASAVRARRACVVYDVSSTLTPYDEAWAWQKAFLATALARGERSTDVAVLAQHPPTVTLGAGSTIDHLKFDESSPPSGFELRRCERGGEATYHGPGQLVLYPILNLARAPHEADLHWYMRGLESVALEAMIDLGLDESKCGRIDGLTGAWCDGHKLAAVGVRARRWVSYHGVALNVCPNLEHFANIVPCGIGDRPVGSVAQILRGEGGVVSSASEATFARAPPARRRRRRRRRRERRPRAHARRPTRPSPRVRERVRRRPGRSSRETDGVTNESTRSASRPLDRADRSTAQPLDRGRARQCSARSRRESRTRARRESTPSRDDPARRSPCRATRAR